LAARRKPCEHGNLICELCQQTYSDAAKRFADGVNGMLAFHQPWELQAKWLAIGLADGSVNSDIYDTRDQAVKHNPDNSFVMPIGNFLQGVKYLDAEIMLTFQRDAHEAGLRVNDGSGKDPILPIDAGDLYRSMIIAGKRMNN
jgi:hypothetical protein